MQTTVSENFAPAVAGLVADDYIGADKITCVAEGDIPSGRLVVQGTGFIDGRPQVKLATGATLGRLVGVSLYNPIKERRAATTPGDISTVPAMWKAGDVMPVLRAGRVWTELVGSAITAAGVALQVRTTAGADQGKITTTAADANNVATGLTSYRPSVGTLALLEINLP